MAHWQTQHASFRQARADRNHLEALLETRDREGLIGTISMDEYGDAVRPNFLITAQDGQSVTLTALKPERE